ncbi:MAG: cysteine synthase A [Elusimicrobiales bacterium]|nr:cysteine synthase A [Elusimicrobiales bacterium]
MKIYKSSEQLIGNTPLIELSRIAKEKGIQGRLLMKTEYFNPAGSIKDRAAKYMLDEAEKSGRIKPGATIIEPTSGNTGIGLAAIGGYRGYKVKIVMPSTMSVERRKMMSAYGAEVILSDGAKGMKGAIALAEELAAKTPGSFIPGQFSNPANAKAHYEGTGPEIYAATDGEIDIFVAGIGTGGTISGAGKYLKERNPLIKVIGAEPASSPFLSEGRAGSHKIQGIGAGFQPEILDRSVIDEIIAVSNEKAFEYASMIGCMEGMLVGISSGAAAYAAVSAALRPENAGKTIVFVAPDGGDRYLSTELYSAD